MKIILCPIGDIDAAVLAELGQSLQDIFGCSMEKGIKAELPHVAYHSRRRQYEATAVLSSLLKSLTGGGAIILGVADADLYTQELNFIFGLADSNRNIALISLARLREEFYGHSRNNRLFMQRALKEAVHELGHLLGLEHCSDMRCVMHFSNSLQDTDIKSTTFCPNCQPRLIQ
jgi:archaemetzincin